MKLKTDKQTTVASRCVNLLIAGLLLFPTYITLMRELSARVGFNTKLTTLICFGLLWFLVLGALPQIGKAIGSKTFVALLLVVLVAILWCVIYPDNYEYIVPTMQEIFLFSPLTLLAVVPYVLIGLAVTDVQMLAKYLHIAARIGVVFGALSYLLAVARGYEIEYDDMSNAYVICILVCILVADYWKMDAPFLAVGVLSLILAGTRGPLVCVVVAAILRVLLVKEAPTKKIFKIIIGLLVILLLQGDGLLYLLDLISDGFRKIGVTKLRIIDYIRDGMLADSSGRDAITDTIWQKTMENPLLGYGPGGDRLILATHAYAHNLILEMWVSYGVIAGTAILGWMGYWCVKGIFGKDKAVQAVSLVLFCGVGIKLLLSSSYLHSKELFLLLGVCIAGCRNQRKKSLC